MRAANPLERGGPVALGSSLGCPIKRAGPGLYRTFLGELRSGAEGQPQRDGDVKWSCSEEGAWPSGYEKDENAFPVVGGEAAAESP